MNPDIGCGENFGILHFPVYTFMIKDRIFSPSLMKIPN